MWEDGLGDYISVACILLFGSGIIRLFYGLLGFL